MMQRSNREGAGIFQEYLYIDYENVQDVQVDAIKRTMKVMIIVGEDQSRVPIDLVQKTQPFGDSVEWVRVNGKGRNALDFFVAYFLGKDVASDRDKNFVIYSKDRGYDPLINHLQQNGINARRIVSFQELKQNKIIKVDEAAVQKIKESLCKVSANRRPKKRNSLNSFVTDLLKGKPQKDIDKIVEDMFIKKVVYEENGTIKYSLEK